MERVIDGRLNLKIIESHNKRAHKAKFSHFFKGAAFYKGLLSFFGSWRFIWLRGARRALAVIDKISMELNK